jgi:hypothetical protein
MSDLARLPLYNRLRSVYFIGPLSTVGAAKAGGGRDALFHRVSA